MTFAIYILALIGALTVVRVSVRLARMDWTSKSGPWLGLPWEPG
jgi:hypothetical protein